MIRKLNRQEEDREILPVSTGVADNRIQNHGKNRNVLGHASSFVLPSFISGMCAAVDKAII